MKKNILFLFLSVFSLQLSARTNFWNDAKESTFASKGQRTWMPQSYRTLKINLSEFLATTNSVPIETNSNLRNSPATLNLPAPDGKEMSFRIVESPVMAPELAAAFPSIKTYLGESIDDPRITARFDITQFGFHAMVFTPDGLFFIDPYVFGNTNEYISYYKHDIKSILPSMICANDDLINEGLSEQPSLVKPLDYSAQRSIGTQFRTYRLALACTGEYGQFFGGTMAGALSGMVTSLNRCNGVYERDLDLRLILVPNDTLLIYLNPANDPYSNNSGSTMLGENQNNVTTLIGSSNFDIGHVFSTGGGGVAYRGCVCTNTNKARGVTGSPNPVNDPFDIDYVVHEMGHQFGANHTFNATSSSCSGNRVSSAAFEPGSASTIMGYAGICGSTNDLQMNSDAYYHSYSFDEIVTYMHNGTGNNCAVTSATGNQVPNVSFAGNYIIPYQTPFRLTATASDPDGDPITYCWEELDHGPSGNWNNPSGDAPIFRSFLPETSPTRFFPKYTSVLNGTFIKGELKPTYARTLHFRCTVRDNRTGGGGVTYNDTLSAVEVINTGSGFAVTYPNAAGISWPEASTQTITWNVAQSDVAPINTPFVNIYLSADNGLTFPVTIGLNVPNTGNYTFNVPNNLTTTARLWIEGAGNIFYDVNDNAFTITLPSAIADLDQENQLAVFPNPANGIVTVALPKNTERLITMNIYNQLGMLVSTPVIKVHTSDTQVDLSSFAEGVYHLRVLMEGVLVDKRIVLVH